MAFEFDIGFLGGGQLARMSIQAAQRLGLRCLSLDPAADAPAAQIAASVVGKLADPDRIGEVLRRCSVVTLENEFIPADSVRQALLESGRDETALMPGVETLATIQDKLRQREALARAGVPSPKAIALRDPDEAIAAIGLPMVLKARFGGYDGRGTRYARTREELEGYRNLWGDGGWLSESFVPFRRELAVMVFVSDDARGAFPTVETRQANHVCDFVLPCDADGTHVAMAAVEAVGGRGLFGVELFELEDGTIQVNEIAPRPHNTGHYTLDWGGVSQFEQHVRLVMRLPLGRALGDPVCMANLLGRGTVGDHRAGLAAALLDPDVHVHWYGKTEMKPGRKMGHLNARGRAGESTEALVQRAVLARERFFDALA